jgi:uncharacterized protein YndB with AHSA1/START domain
MATANNDEKFRELMITRTFDAPRALVWKAWTDPALVMRWWGPAGYTAPSVTIDFHTGGKYLYCMRSMEGKDFWSTGRFLEIRPMERIVVTDSFADENGTIVPASHYDMPGDWPLELVVAITFEEQGDRTKFTVTYDSFPAAGMFEFAKAGWTQSIDKLARVLAAEQAGTGKTLLVAEPGAQSASMVRVFNAPPEILFGAMTDPKLLVQWWAPRRFAIIVDWLDVRPGGSWRILNRDADGNEFAFHGVYHEVSPARIVQTFEFEGMPGHVLLGIVTLEDLGGRTRVTSTSVFESVGDRDGMLLASMNDGGLETFDRLAELVEEPVKK